MRCGNRRQHCRHDRAVGPCPAVQSVAVLRYGRGRPTPPRHHRLDRARPGRSARRGADLIDTYLAPPAAHPAIADRIRLRTKVVAITRVGYDRVRTAGREAAPFARTGDHLGWRRPGHRGPGRRRRARHLDHANAGRQRACRRTVKSSMRTGSCPRCQMSWEGRYSLRRPSHHCGRCRPVRHYHVARPGQAR